MANVPDDIIGQRDKRIHEQHEIVERHPSAGYQALQVSLLREDTALMEIINHGGSQFGEATMAAATEMASREYRNS